MGRAMVTGFMLAEETVPKIPTLARAYARNADEPRARVRGQSYRLIQAPTKAHRRAMPTKRPGEIIPSGLP